MQEREWWAFDSPEAPEGKVRLLLVCPLKDERVLKRLRREVGSFSHLPPSLCVRPPWHGQCGGGSYQEWLARRTFIMATERAVDGAVKAGPDPRYDYDLTPSEVDARLPGFLEREKKLTAAAVNALFED